MMAYFSSKLKFHPFRDSLSPTRSIPLFQRLSLRRVKGIVVAALACTILAFLFLWQPAFLHLRSLRTDITYWQQVLKSGSTYPESTIPTMDQLPDMIEQCRGVFVQKGVQVVDLNVERFGERRETGNGASLDYSLVRLHLRGNWEGIVTSLKVLEGTQECSFHVQEVILNSESGEVLLQIHFSTGD